MQLDTVTLLKLEATIQIYNGDDYAAVKIFICSVRLTGRSESILEALPMVASNTGRFVLQAFASFAPTPFSQMGRVNSQWLRTFNLL